MQRALWDFSLHVTEEKAKAKGHKDGKPTGRRFINSDKVRDGERRNEADSFTLVSRALGFTPSKVRVTSAVLKFGGVVTVEPGSADNEVTVVEREKVIVTNDSTERRVIQLAHAMREHHEDRYPDDGVWMISYSRVEVRNILNAYRANRCKNADGKPLKPIAPNLSEDASDLKRVLAKAQEQGWLAAEDGEYRRTK